MKSHFNYRLLSYILASGITLTGCGKHKSSFDSYAAINTTTTSYESISDIEDESISESNDIPLYESIPCVCASTSVNVRSGDSLGSSIIGGMTTGSKYVLLDHLDGWYKIDYYGRDAYVSDSYTYLSSLINGDYKKIVCLVRDSNLTSDNWSIPINAYEMAFVLDEDDSSYFVSCCDEVGFIPKCDCIDLDGYFAVIDKSDQKLDVYHDQDLLISSPCVTGKDSSPTSTGLHEIWCVRHNCYLTGPGYRSYVHNFLAFNGGQGLHDASWRDLFGTDQYHSHGSHGCVNLPMDVGEKISAVLTTGDKVLVKK